ncbi:hypothetical protein PINS_up007985 [Pythium insidiosum]|nr:hypothetical protein PINS_up007985 [Pythium insidiosum]
MMRAISSLLLLLGTHYAVAHLAGKTECNNYSSRFKKNLDGVCVCNEWQCDAVSNAYLTLKSDQVGVYTTSKAGDRLTFRTQSVATGGDSSGSAQPVHFVVEPDVRFQTMLGFGGAFTDAAAINVNRLSSALQTRVLEAYFGNSGLEYSMGRVPIASCDFSESVYSYNDVEGDLAMEHFSIDVDRSPRSFKLELIHRALRLSRESGGRELRLFASSWAPPTWMTRENRTENCHLKGSPGDKYWKALALYYVKFIEAYEKEGVPIWGLTVQNEPVQPPLELKKWQSLRLTADEERDFIKKDLGPLLKSKYPKIKLISNDDQKPDLMDRISVVDDPEAKKFIDGVGVHWYKNFDFFFFGLGGDFDKLSAFHKQHPDLFILPTEACEGDLPDWIGTGNGVKLHDSKLQWQRAENYAHDILGDIANFAAGWMDWNLVLDTTGGPNWAKNNVDAPILVDETSGSEFYKQPMYYVMGQLSKFVPSGSVRVNLRTEVSANWDRVERVAFVTPAGRVVVVVCNRRDSAVTMSLRVPAASSSSGQQQQKPQRRRVAVDVPAHAIQTIIFPVA